MSKRRRFSSITCCALRELAERRLERTKMKSLCLSVFLLHFAPALHERYVLPRKRHTDKLRQRRWRKKKKIHLRIAKLEAKRAKVAQEISALEEKMRIKELKRRKRLTASQGTQDGWFAAENPKTDVELKDAGYRGPYRQAYLAAVKDKLHWLAAMAKQQQQAPMAQSPRLIRL